MKTGLKFKMEIVDEESIYLLFFFFACYRMISRDKKNE